jgi:hypothetical protein
MILTRFSAFTGGFLMLRQATTLRTKITLLCISTLILALTFTGCYKLDPLSSSNNTSYSPPEPGGIGNDGLTTMTQLGATDNGGWEMTTDFFDKTNTSLGAAKIQADADLVSFVASKNFNIPGTTQLTFNNNATVTVNVTESSATKYRVTLTSSTAPGTPVWFQIDNLDAAGLGKKAADASAEETQAVDPALFAGYVATHIILIIGNPEVIIGAAQSCREEAIATCGSFNKVESFYVIVTFSLQYGLEIDCFVDCTHDQGRWGFY